MRRTPLLLLALALPVLPLLAVGPAVPTDSTGPVTWGKHATCSFTSNAITTISVQAPKAAMRKYWTVPHGGQVARAQYVKYTVTLEGKSAGKWRTLISRTKPTLVGRTQKLLAAPPAFKTGSGIKAGYDAYRVKQKVIWLRPTDNRVEGSLTKRISAHKDGRVARAFCVRTHPTVTTASLYSATIGTAYSKPPVTATGIAPFSWSLPAGNPDWLALSPSGTFGGTVAGPRGTKNVVLKVKDGNGVTATRTLSMNVDFIGGDANGDAAVTCADYNAWSANNGDTSATHAQGDFNNDGSVNAADRQIFNNTYSGTPDCGGPWVSVAKGVQVPPGSQGCLQQCYRLLVTTRNYSGTVSCQAHATLPESGFIPWSQGANATYMSQNWVTAYRGIAVWVTCGGIDSKWVQW